MNAQSTALVVSIRELKVLIERNLMLLGVPKGAWNAVRDFVVDLEALGLGGLSALDRAGEDGTAWAPAPVPAPGGDRLVIDATGIHAMFLGPFVADLAHAVASRGLAVEVRNATRADLLAALPHQSRRHLRRDLCAEQVPGASGAWRVRVPAAAGDRSGYPCGDHLDSVVSCGHRVEPDLWWRLYHRSGLALAEETPESLRDAGAMIVTGSGTLTKDGEIDVDYAPPQFARSGSGTSVAAAEGVSP